MKKITQKLLFFTIAVMGISVTTAQVAPNGLWSAVGNTTMSTVTDDGDNGDGANDGALFFDGQDSNGPLGAKFTFNGIMEDAATYDIVTNVYNIRSSYVNFVVSLHNKTDDVQLAASATISLGNGATTQAVETVSLTYTAVADDAGDVLELRYIRIENNSGRDFAIDNASLNGTFVTEALSAVSPNGKWSVVDASEATPTILSFITTDEDNGDGVGDGAILVDGKNTVDPQGAKFTLTETMVDGKRYKAESTIYKASASYSRAKLQLYNATDNVLLASSGQLVFDNGGPIKIGTVTYDALATDVGDVLEIRWVRDDGNAGYRDFAIDNAKINDAIIVINEAAVLSISDNKLNDAISIYPNPTANFINISTANASIKNVKLIDVTGKVIYKNNNAQPINVRNYSKGLYILKIESNEGGVASKKVIIN
jgi:hypothetical protein